MDAGNRTLLSCDHLRPIVQEVISRVTGRELAEHFQDLVALPLAADATLKGSAQVLERAAFLTETEAYRSTATAEIERWVERSQTLGGAFQTDQGRWVQRPQGACRRPLRVRRLGNRCRTGAIWSAVVVATDGVRLLDDDSIAGLCRPRSEGPMVFGAQPPYQRWGAGVLLCSEAAPWFTPASFGHGGVGGQAGIADPELKVGLGHVRSRLDVQDSVPGIIRQVNRILTKET